MKSRFNGWKIDPEAKRIWVEALRSGEYEQARGTLKGLIYPYGISNTGFCCLGVKCELDGTIGKRGSVVVDSTIKEGEPLYGTSYINTNTIPEAVQRVLAGYNDEGKSFKWIAAYIDRYL